MVSGPAAGPPASAPTGAATAGWCHPTSTASRTDLADEVPATPPLAGTGFVGIRASARASYAGPSTNCGRVAIIFSLPLRKTNRYGGGRVAERTRAPTHTYFIFITKP